MNFAVNHDQRIAGDPTGTLTFGERRILYELEHVIGTKMSELSDAVAALTADDQALEAEVAQAITTIQGIPATTAAAVQAALTQAGVDDATAATALASVDTAVKASTAQLLAALTPTPAQTSSVAPQSLAGA